MVPRSRFLWIFGDIAGNCGGTEAALLPAGLGDREMIGPWRSDERIKPRLQNFQSLQILREGCCWAAI